MAAGLIHTRQAGWFPFSLEEISRQPPVRGPFTAYPVGVPLDEAMGWFWRVRTWEVTISHQLDERSGNKRAYTIGGNPAVTNTYPYETGPNQTTLTRMQDVVCSEARIGIWAGVGRSLRDELGQGEFAEVAYQLLTSLSFTGFYYEPATRLCWPRLRVSGWLDSLQAGHPYVQQQLDPRVSFYLGATAIPVRAYWFPNWVEEPGWTVTGGTQIRFSPVYF